MRVAHIAITASPSTISPCSSITITRSASPSSAMPMRASRRTTSAFACSGCSAPVSRLMFVPFGRTPIGNTRAPSSANTSGATT